MTNASRTHSPTVILIGASVRAAADSAARAGWTTWCADLFADRDLRLHTDARAIANEQYPHAFLDLLKHAPAAPVIYTGALENHPALIAKIDRPIWGNPPDVLCEVRDPSLWTAALADARQPHPRVTREPQTTGRWLLKPIRSAAGIGIVPYQRQGFNPRTHFLQQQIEGTPVSALCLGMGERANLLAVTAQLIGTPWLHASGFHYAGSYGPLSLTQQELDRWLKLVKVVAERFRLRGLFGIDAIMQNGTPWPIEINPRYTASVEIVERATGIALLDWHRHVFEGDSTRTLDTPWPKTCHGKAVMYAKETFDFPHDGPWMNSLARRTDLDSIAFADIPDAGTPILASHPVLTLFASSPNPAQCAIRLEEIASNLARTLWA